MRKDMTRLLMTASLIVILGTAALAGAGLARASTTVAWKATFNERFGGAINSPFDCPPGTSCGTGEVTGLGQAKTLVVLGACGVMCNALTLTFGDRSTLVMDEYASNFQTPGNSANAFSLDLSLTVVGGTGRFAHASGTASGQVKISGTAVANLSGTVTF
jgi:hypothetical protein